MSDLKQTAQLILEMTGRTPLHSDPKVEQQILIQDIADMIERSEVVGKLRREALDLDYQNRQLRRELEESES